MGSGRVGLAARAIVFALVGYFLLRTAIDSNPVDARGTAGALGFFRGGGRFCLLRNSEYGQAGSSPIIVRR